MFCSRSDSGIEPRKRSWRASPDRLVEEPDFAEALRDDLDFDWPLSLLFCFPFFCFILFPPCWISDTLNLDVLHLARLRYEKLLSQEALYSHFELLRTFFDFPARSALVFFFIHSR